MRRKKLSRRSSKRVFRSSSGSKKRNRARRPMRGGFRL